MLIALNYLQLLALLLLLPATIPIAAMALPVRASLKYTPAFNQHQGKSGSEIAKLVSVRILSNPGVGTGVIVARQGHTYTVLTCEHVVTDSKNNVYQLITVDGRSHQATWNQTVSFGNADLALVQFRSDRTYQVVKIASKQLSIGEQVYAAGFPNWHWIDKKTIENTRNWGFSAFKLTTGTVELVLTRSLPKDYRIGYTNEIENGMSGGPVLNSQGQLIGINGRLKYPLQGIEAFTFADGTVPTQEFFEQMQALSWAVPIEILLNQERPLGSI